MSYIGLYDYDNSFEPIGIPCANMAYSSVDNIPEGDVVDATGVEWTIDKSTSGNMTTYTYTAPIGSNTILSPSALMKVPGLNTLINAMGSNCMAMLDDMGVGTEFRAGADDQSISYPYYGFLMDEHASGNKRYKIQLAQNAGTGTSREVVLSDSAHLTFCPVAFTTDSEDIYGGCVYGLFWMETYDNGYTKIYLTYDNAINNNTFDTEYQPDPGNQGFKPRKNKFKKPRGGGSKSGTKASYLSDVLTNPGEPDESEASVAGAGFIHVYKIDSQNLENLGEALFSQNMIAFINDIYMKPMDFVLSLNIFPCRPTNTSSQILKLGSHPVTLENFGVICTADKLNRQFKTFHFGTLSCAEMFESFLDYDSSAFSLYLPFIGEVDIDINEVMNGSITVDYTVDFYTGMCVANVLCEKVVELDDVSPHQYSQHSFQGNCSVQVPLGAESYGAMVGSLINACAVGLKGNVAGATLSFAADGISGGWAPTVSTKGSVSANAGFCSVLYPYVTITRPIPAENDTYQEVMGYPSYLPTNLGECQGLCVCEDILLENVPYATDNELSRIKQLCKEGIIV